jgi:hypothetical protein
MTIGTNRTQDDLYVSSINNIINMPNCYRFSQTSGTWQDILGTDLPYIIQQFDQKISYVAYEDTVQLCFRDTSDAFIKLAKRNKATDSWSLLTSSFTAPTKLRLSEDNSIYGTCWVLGVSPFPDHLVLMSNTQVYPPGILKNYRMYISVKKNGDDTRNLVPITTEPAPLPGEVPVY